MYTSALLALTLATPDAAAADIKIKNIRIRQTNDSNYRVVATTEGTGAATLDASVEAGGVGETVPLVEGDGWLHGTATLAALPATDAAAMLTVYDSASAVLATYTGTFLATGALRLVRADYCGTGNTCARDLDLLGADAYGGAAGYDVALDLAGADAADVAYATLALTVTGEPKCVAWDAGGKCLKYESATATTTAEVGWDTLATAWEGDLALPVEGALDVTVTARDTDGDTLTHDTALLAPAWDDGGAGVAALATDEDALTSVALVAGNGVKELADILENQYRVVVSSDGWAADDTLPTYAEVTLDGGTVWTVPVNSYQVAAATPIGFTGDAALEAFVVTVDGKTFTAASPVGERGLCQHGTCVALTRDDDGAWTLSATAYAATAGALPKTVTVALAGKYGKAAPTARSYTLAYDTDVAVVFGAEAAVEADPAGLDLTGKIRLRGRSTLYVGFFGGQFATDDDGDLGLATIPHGGPVDSRGDILLGGEPIGVELTADTDGDGIIEAPPAVVRKNGTGTRTAAATQTQQSQLL